MLLDGFDAFADHLQVQGMGHRDNGLDDFPVLQAGRHVLQEATVYLQDVQGQAFEVGQRRITGAEIVDRQAHPLATNALEQADCALDIAHQCVFGNLQLQVARRQACMEQGHFHLGG